MSKGDKPRNCFSRQYRDNYDSINWPKEMTRLDRKSGFVYKGPLQSLAPALSGVSTDDQVKISEK